MCVRQVFLHVRFLCTRPQVQDPWALQQQPTVDAALVLPRLPLLQIPLKKSLKYFNKDNVQILTSSFYPAPSQSWRRPRNRTRVRTNTKTRTRTTAPLPPTPHNPELLPGFKKVVARSTIPAEGKWRDWTGVTKDWKSPDRKCCRWLVDDEWKQHFWLNCFSHLVYLPSEWRQRQAESHKVSPNFFLPAGSLEEKKR